MLTLGNVLIQFDPVAEKRLLRKIDLYVVPTVAMIYLWCFIDRANIGNAKIAGMEKDLGLKGYQYHILLTAFYVSYIVFEVGFAERVAEAEAEADGRSRVISCASGWGRESGCH